MKVRIGLIVTVALLSVSMLGAVTFAQPAAAADCVGIQTSVIDCSTANDETGSAAIAILVIAIQVLTGLIGITAIGAFIYAGIMYSSASGNASQVAKAKEIMRNTVIGLLIFAALAVIINFLIPGGLFEGSARFGAGGNGLGSQGAAPLKKDPNLANPSSPESDDSDIVSTTPYSLTVASWNSLKDNDTANKGDSVKALLGSADIIGLQEVATLAQQNSIKAAESSKVGVYYPGTLKSGGANQLSYPVVYNKDKLAFITGGYKRLGSTAGYSDTYAVYVKLRIKATGQEFYVANAQLPPNVEINGEPQSTDIAGSYRQQMSVLRDLASQLGANGNPTFLVGDLSVDFRKDDCGVSWFPCKSLRAANMKSAYEVTRLADTPSTTGTVRNGSRLVDYVFVRTDSRVKVNSVTVLGSSDGYRGSTHRPSLAKVTISAKIGTTPQPKNTPTTKEITLKGVDNFRDLAALNPSIVKAGVVYRSGKLQNATTADRIKLATALKGGVIIDLRAADKRSAEPDRPITGVPNLSYDVDAATGANEYVKVFVNDKDERLEFGKALTKIAETKGPVLFHCTYGKDRTGWMAAMIMYILGANDQQVMAEYLESRDAGLTVEKEWLNAALSAARKNNNGSIMNYIQSDTKGLGVSDDTIAKLRTKLGK